MPRDSKNMSKHELALCKQKYNQKLRVFRQVRIVRHKWRASGLLVGIIQVNLLSHQMEDFWLKLFGSLEVHCDMLQFLHAIDTCDGWPADFQIKDKVLIFKILAKDNICTYQSFSNSVFAQSIPYMDPKFISKEIPITEGISLEKVMKDLARSILYRRVDLEKMDISDSALVGVEELQVITPRIYRPNALKAAAVSIMMNYCDSRNMSISEMVEAGNPNITLWKDHLRPTAEGPWMRDLLFEACEEWDRAVVRQEYLQSTEFLKLHIQSYHTEKAVQEMELTRKRQEAEVQRITAEEDKLNAANDAIRKQEKANKI